jgi:hypothetical protein
MANLTLQVLVHVGGHIRLVLFRKASIPFLSLDSTSRVQGSFLVSNKSVVVLTIRPMKGHNGLDRL